MDRLDRAMRVLRNLPAHAVATQSRTGQIAKDELRNRALKAMKIPATNDAVELPKPEAVTLSRVEIVLTGGRRMIVDTSVDTDALARLLDIVDRRR